MDMDMDKPPVEALSKVSGQLQEELHESLRKAPSEEQLEERPKEQLQQELQEQAGPQEPPKDIRQPDLVKPQKSAAPVASLERQLELGMSELQSMFDRFVPGAQLEKSNSERDRDRGEEQQQYFFGALLDQTSVQAQMQDVGQNELNEEEKEHDENEENEEETEERELQQAVCQAQSHLKAGKFLNLLLIKLWRRRRSEVLDLHALVRKYQQQAASKQNELFLRNQLICMEQRRGEQLALQLVNAVNRVKSTSHCCSDIEAELKQLRAQESQLLTELRAKVQECDNYSELLRSCKTELFREMARYREAAAELANEQRQTQRLQVLNGELEDELHTIKDRFREQSDKMGAAVTRKQELLDIAYEQLKDYEQELSELELKHHDLLLSKDNEAALQLEIAGLKREMGVVRYIFFHQLVRRCRQFRLNLADIQNFAYEILGNVVQFLMLAPPSPPPPPPVSLNSVRFCMALAFLLVVVN